jgi:hypothetical protein
VPSKRQPSKQRRASQSRARRDALAARVEHAAESPAPRSSSDTSTSSTGTARRPGLLGSLFGGGGAVDARSSTRARGGAGRAAAPLRPAESYWGGLPGLWQVAAALGLGVVAFVVVLFANLATVDDRGELIPRPFGGVHLAIRSLDAGHEVGRESTTILDAGGPAYLALYAAPLVVLAVAFLMYRSTRRSRVLTVSLLAMAVLFFTSGYLFLLSLLMLGWATVVGRRYDVAPRSADDDAIEADAVDEEYVEDEYDEDDEDLDEDDAVDEEYVEDEYDEEDDEVLVEDEELLDEDEEYDEEDEELADEDEDLDEEYDDEEELVDEDEDLDEEEGVEDEGDEEADDTGSTSGYRDLELDEDEPVEDEEPTGRKRRRR